MQFRVLAVFLCLGMFVASAVAQGSADASGASALATLEKARELSDLHRAGTPSFRLEASFETYDYKGMADGKGSLTEAYLRDGFWQRSIRYRDKHTVITSVDGTAREVSDADYQSTFPLRHIVDDLFAPIPSGKSMERYTFKMKTVSAGGSALSCVIGSLPYLATAPSTDVDFHPGMVIARHELTKEAMTAPNEVYCVDKDPAILRVVEGHIGVTFTFNRIIRFGAVYVPGDITMMERGKLRAHLHVDGIVAVPELSEKDIVLPPADSGVPELLRLATVAGRAVRQPAPDYPVDAKQRHVQGLVVLHAILGKDGHVRDLELVSAPDDSLVESAMDAVRRWVYSPYPVNGSPVEVEATINVKFQLQ